MQRRFQRLRRKWLPAEVRGHSLPVEMLGHARSSPGSNFCVATRLRFDPPEAAVSARFRRAFVRLADSSGEIDEIEVVEEGITVNGGDWAGFSFLISGTEAEDLQAGGFADSSRRATVRKYEGTPQVWRVPEDYTRVPEAVEAASPGDTVRVGPGTFEGNDAWIVDRDRIVLVGAGAGRTFLKARKVPIEVGGHRSLGKCVDFGPLLPQG